MKTRFNSFDIVCMVTELQKLIGMRVNNIYDIDNKTYLIRLQQSEDKKVLLLESGNRIHTTNFEWPKNVAPSGFSMKLRKHLKNKRLERLNQVGLDRIIELQFGTGEAAYHVILELYDRGNIILTDYKLTILNILRPHTEGDKLRFAVREQYPQDRRRDSNINNIEDLKRVLKEAKFGDPIKKILLYQLDFGSSLIEHVLLNRGFTGATKLEKTFDIDRNVNELYLAIEDGKAIIEDAKHHTVKGFLIQKKEERPSSDSNSTKEYFYSNQEFHSMLFEQHKSEPYQEYETFNLAVDEFFSSLNSQKIELRALQQEKEAIKKLNNIKKDHVKRLIDLGKTQETDKQKAELITRNRDLVDNAILIIQSALANQISWQDIDKLVKDATSKGDSVAKHIKQLKLDINHIIMYLTDPFVEERVFNNSDEEYEESLPAAMIEIDLALSAFANARSYYNKKRFAAKKQQKTMESQGKALKSAEKKTKQALKEVQTITNIHKARKVYWFEKFFWFISSENYLVLAGRDQQQNELLVKRYMKPKDVYVHADVHGASSVLIKNPQCLPVPPKTLNEAGTMAISYSVTWEAKIITNAYWVYGEQVSKSAPAGEYLPAGSFMIRDKKNFLPASQLSLGLGFLFRVEDSYIEKHLGERKVMGHDEFSDVSEVGEVELEVADEEESDNKSASDVMLDKQIEPDDLNSHTNLIKFPDTHVKITHTEGTKINVVAEVVNIFPFDKQETTTVQFNSIIEMKSQNKNPQKQKSIQVLEQKDINIKTNISKRGQKGKLKKIREKYKDQDEEERRLRMEILQSAGSAKDSKKNRKTKETQNTKIIKPPKLPRVPVQKNENEDCDEDEPIIQVEIDMINALTGKPHPDDELLFAIPVVSPYNTLVNYKFKVKITPGTSKRGKAVKTAVNMFLNDRSSTQRERDLLKAVKEEQIARNLPGKVKLSAPKLQILKK
ncbi:hypothetical protein FQA39_LY06928 [Lamprigera yunnana]|nr:hypothetical protein FQA39_LY06928 [Lamprigera yunnana]